MKQFFTQLFFSVLMVFAGSVLAQSPTMPPFNFNVNFVGTSGANIGWTNGNGTGRMVILRPAQPVAIDVTTFDATGNFSNNYTDPSTTFDGDHKRIYQGANASVSINNLQPGAVYHVAIYEYTQWPTPQFNPNPLRGFFTTLPSQGLAIGGFLPFVFCTEELFSLPFLYSGAFDPGNTIVAQLSDANGDFTSPSVMGSVATVNGSGAVPCQIPSGIPAGTDYRFRLISSQPADTSSVYPISIEIVSLDKPQITSVTGATISCGAPLTLQTDSGFSYQWFRNGVAIVNANAQTLQVDSSGHYQVEISSASVSCTSTSDSILIEIQSLPHLNFQISSSVCFSDSLLSLSATPVGGVFSGPGVFGNVLLLDSAGAGQHQIWYTYTDTTTSCTDSIAQIITIFSNPTIAFSVPDSVSITAPAFALDATPTGGVFSGNGIVGDTLTPFAAGLGSHFVAYTVVDSNGCTATDSTLITVFAPLQTIVAPTLDTLCLNEDSLALPGTGMWAGIGVSSNTFIIDSTAGVGAYWLTYSEELVPGYFEADSTQLFVVANPIDTQNYVLCFGDSVQQYGQTFMGTGVHTITVSNPTGCDSIIVIQTNELPQVLDSLSVTLCSGDSLIFNNQVLDTAGIYHFVNTAATGCDSTTVLTLQVTPLPVTNINLTLCAGDSILIGATYYQQAGNFQERIPRFNVCDSIVNLSLTIDTTATIATQLVDTLCSGDSFNVGGQQFAQTGFYAVTLTNANGCDSVVELDLTVLPAFRDTTIATICTGDSIFFMGDYYSTAGSFTVADTLSSGCDSIRTLELSLIPRPQRPVIIRNNLLPGLEVIPATGDFYEWYRDGVLLPNDTTASIPNAGGGQYSVIMYVNGCPSLPSVQVVYSGLGNENFELLNVQIAPNPALDQFNILGLSGLSQEVRLLDLTGRVVHHQVSTDEETTTIGVAHLARGAYTLQVVWQDGTHTQLRLLLQ
ncbi:MAG: T9SS type A sorting domain-containing protein [Schleiferiaceae bacterium]|nr:T9SS type A sorting domain-containing protein [Schleiferiaceae bacterium]